MPPTPWLAPYVGLDRHYSTWAFYCLALMVLAAGVARAGLVQDERRAWTAGAAAFAAWFMGSVFYATGGGAEKDLYAFPVADALLLPFAGAAAATVALLLPSRVKPYQPTLLLDGLIVALAAGAVCAMAMDATFLHGLEASNVVITLKAAYPLGALVLLAFAVWVQAATGWHLDRTWTAAVAGFALAGVSSTAFLLETVSGSYSAGTIVDSLWLAGGLVLAYAAWQPSGGAMPIHLQGQRRLAVTSVGAAVALGVLVLGQMFSIGFAAVALAAAALIVLISRAAVSFKESLQMFTHARIEAQTDALTTLGNRRKLMTDLRRELPFASVASPRILVLFDLDGFKRYNDTYGHPAGDVLLARLGGNLERAIKPYGAAYRIGGDEFCVLVMTGRVEREDDHRAGDLGAVRAGRGLLDQGLARHRDVAPRSARRDTRAADRGPAHVRAEGGPALLRNPPGTRHPAAGPARARACARQPSARRRAAGPGRRHSYVPDLRGAR